MSQTAELMNIPLELLDLQPEGIREVNIESEEFKEFCDSVKLYGIQTPILARRMAVQNNGHTENRFVVVDGAHRTVGARLCGLDTIPAKVVEDMNALNIIQASLVGNIHRVEMRPVECCNALRMILQLNPTLTRAELASKLGKSVKWIDDRLSLVHLNDKIKPLVEDGTIVLVNAYALAKIKDKDEQLNLSDSAKTMNSIEFLGLVQARAKEIRDAQKQGRDTREVEFVNTPNLRKLGELKSELTSLAGAERQLKISGKTDPKDVWKLAVEWVLQVDSDSVNKRKEEDAARKKKREEEKAAAKKERELAKGLKTASKEDLERAMLQSVPLPSAGEIQADAKAKAEAKAAKAEAKAK